MRFNYYKHLWRRLDDDFRDNCTSVLTDINNLSRLWPYLVKSTQTLIVFKSRHTSECAAIHTSLSDRTLVIPCVLVNL